MMVRVTPAGADPLAVERVAHTESAPELRECLPARRIALIRFALGEVEPSAEDERLSPLV